ncbi:hypothetical protein [Microbacterium istanbulense]|uniref:Uncharacterized protein n=1 Tax=Microbacterium istanbulense TaxID=3122049 RepID=A0ABU8LIF2_9MICO
MRRHVHWIALLLAAPLTYVVVMLVVEWLDSVRAEARGDAIVWLTLSIGVALVVAVVAPVVLLIRSIVQMRRTFRRSQRAKGRFTAFERRQLDAATDAAAWWEYARRLRGQVLNRQVPESQQQWDVVPYEGERFFACLPLTYARYYGKDVGYTTSGMVAVGSPAFVVGAFAVSAIANASARSRAAKEAAPQWREWQQTTAYVTNHRIVTYVNGEWLTFEYGAISALYPDVASNALVCQFGSTEPLLLSGPATPVAAVVAVLQTHGLDGVRDHPGLQELARPAATPSLPPVGRRE